MNSSNDFGEFLKNLRESKGLSVNQLAMYSGVSSASISRIENGKRGTPKPDTLKKLAEALKFDYKEMMDVAGYIENDDRDAKIQNALEQYAELIKWDKSPEELKELIRECKNPLIIKRTTIPIIGTVKAGPNGLAYKEFLGNETVDSDSVQGGDYYYFKVIGDSMIGDGILDGDLALVREQPEVDSGSLAVVIVNGEEGTLKRVYIQSDSVILQSSNPNYPPRVFVGKECEKVRIFGKVKETKRKY